MYHSRDRVYVKMRRIKEISIRKYVVRFTVLLLLAVLLLMLIFVKMMAESAVKYDIQGDLVNAIVENTKAIHFNDNDEMSVESSFWFEKNGMRYMLVDDMGEMIFGDAPEGMDEKIPPEMGKLKLISVNGTSYYIYDRISKNIAEHMGTNVYCRCVIKQSEVKSTYRTIERISYLLIPIFLLSVLVFGFVISHKISKPLIEIAENANAIGDEKTLSSRIRYSGNISELRTLVDKNNQMLERLEKMFEAQKQFSSDVAHELRTPVAVLLAQCEYSKENAQTKEELEEALEVLYRQTKKTNDIITQLLNLNRMESGRINLDLEKMNLGEIVESICEEEMDNTDKQIDYELEIAEVSAWIDVGLIYIVIQNLIRNAIKYSDDPVSIHITVGENAANYYVAVKDYGEGISKENISLIFKPFYRIEKSRNSEGYGLGLPLAERIAKLHGGSIEVESEVGLGSTFTLVLPKNGN